MILPWTWAACDQRALCFQGWWGTLFLQTAEELAILHTNTYQVFCVGKIFISDNKTWRITELIWQDFQIRPSIHHPLLSTSPMFGDLSGKHAQLICLKVVPEEIFVRDSTHTLYVIHRKNFILGAVQPFQLLSRSLAHGHLDTKGHITHLKWDVSDCTIQFCCTKQLQWVYSNSILRSYKATAIIVHC